MTEAADKLNVLRAALVQEKLDSFIVPMADEYQNEYVPPHARRLHWLTGFDGSFGLVIVLQDAAAIFVDGRYTLQVRQQVDETLFEIRHITDEPPQDWLEEHLATGQRLGFDPWLHTPNQLKRFQAACTKAGADLTPVEQNPIDSVWVDRPERIRAEIVPHGKEFAGETSDTKRQRIAAKLQENDARAAVLTAPDSIAWLLNIRGGDVIHTPLVLSYAILYDDGAVDWFVEKKRVTNDVSTHLGSHVAVHGPDDFSAVLGQLGEAGETVWIDPDSAPQKIAALLKDGGAALVEKRDPCQLPKAVKNAIELEGARAAHRRDGAALCRFLAWLDNEAPKGSVDEYTAAERLANLRAGVEYFRDLSFDAISGSGPNGAIVHYRVNKESARRLEPGSLYLVDSGGQYLDGTTDVTRTIPVGTAPDAAKEPFTRVLKGHIAIATALFPHGTTGSQIDALARLPLWYAGLDYDHGTGHGVGSYLGVHEGPQRISKVPNTVPLEPGMIVSNEPGYYREGEFGIRIENLVAVTQSDVNGDDGNPMLAFETLTLAPIDRRLIVRDLLSDDERDWLNAYHRRVRDELVPLLDDEIRVWLDKKTAPI